MLASDPPVRIRRITADDGPLLRDLRLRSLADAQEAFGQPYEEAEAQPAAEWASAAKVASTGDRRAWLIAERLGPSLGDAAPDGPQTVGIVLGRRRPPDTLLDLQHVGGPARCAAPALAAALIDAAERWAAGWGARRSVLWVFAANEPAIRFYLRLGFRTDMEGEDARTGAAYGALAMSRPIAPSGPREPT